MFQGGVEITDVGYYSDDYVQNGFKDVKSGVTLEVAETYVLYDLESPVEIEVHDFMTLSGEDELMVYTTFDLNNL